MANRQIRDLLSNRDLKFKDRIKIVFNSLSHAVIIRRWLNYIQDSPLLGNATSVFTLLATKIHRPYFSSRLNVAGRVNVLIEHYDAISRLGLEPLIGKAIISDQLLYEGPCKSGKPFQIKMTAVHEAHREGEVCLHLYFDGEDIFELNFVLGTHDAQLCMKISRLQGKKGDQARELVRLATRDLHACRPANLIVVAARQIAQVLGCRSVMLVSNRQRITLNLKRRLRITANYDQTWIEMGATLQSDGFFKIDPIAMQQVDFNEIPSKKRSEARKKVEMLDQMYSGLKALFEAEMQQTVSDAVKEPS